MGTLPFPPKRTGHHYPAHLAVEAISNGENGGLIFSRMEAIVASPTIVASPKHLFIVSIRFFVNEKKKQPLHLFWFKGTSAECFGKWEWNLTTAALALWQI